MHRLNFLVIVLMPENTDLKDRVEFSQGQYAVSLAKRVSNTTQMDHGYTAVAIKLASAIAMGLFVFVGPLAALSVPAIAVGGASVALPALVFVIPATVTVSALKSFVQLVYHYRCARSTRSKLQAFINNHNDDIKMLVNNDADYGQRVVYSTDFFYQDSVGLRNMINKALDTHLDGKENGNIAKWTTQYDKLLALKQKFEQSGGSDFHFHSLRYKQHFTMFIKKLIIFMTLALVVAVTFLTPAGFIITPTMIAGVLLANGIVHVRNEMARRPERYRSMSLITKLYKIPVLFIVGVMRKLPFAHELHRAASWLVRQGKRTFPSISRFRSIDTLSKGEHVKLAAFVELLTSDDKTEKHLDQDTIDKLLQVVGTSSASHPMLRDAQRAINNYMYQSSSTSTAPDSAALKQHAQYVQNQLQRYVNVIQEAAGSYISNDHITTEDVAKRSRINPTLAVQTILSEVVESRSVIKPSATGVVADVLKDHYGEVDTLSGSAESAMHFAEMQSHEGESHAHEISDNYHQGQGVDNHASVSAGHESVHGSAHGVDNHASVSTGHESVHGSSSGTEHLAHHEATHQPGMWLAHHLLGFTYPAMVGFKIADDITYQRHLRMLWQQLDPMEFKKKNRVVQKTVNGRMAYDLLYRRLPDAERDIRTMCTANAEAKDFIERAHRVISQKEQSGLYSADDVHQAKTNVFLFAKRLSELHTQKTSTHVALPGRRSSIEDIQRLSSTVRVETSEAQDGFKHQLDGAHEWLNSPLGVMNHAHKSIGMLMQ